MRVPLATFEPERINRLPEVGAKRIEGEFKPKYPTWPTMNVSGFVRSIYAE